MQDEELELSEELLNDLSVDEISELKVEVDDILNTIEGTLDNCNESSNLKIKRGKIWI